MGGIFRRWLCVPSEVCPVKAKVGTESGKKIFSKNKHTSRREGRTFGWNLKCPILVGYKGGGQSKNPNSQGTPAQGEKTSKGTKEAVHKKKKKNAGKTEVTRN